MSPMHREVERIFGPLLARESFRLFSSRWPLGRLLKGDKIVYANQHVELSFVGEQRTTDGFGLLLRPVGSSGRWYSSGGLLCFVMSLPKNQWFPLDEYVTNLEQHWSRIVEVLAESNADLLSRYKAWERESISARA